MKKLIALLLLSPLAFAEDLTIIDYDSDVDITVYCISGYVFIQKGKSDNLVQLMRQSPKTSNKSHTTPMTCDEYGVEKN